MKRVENIENKRRSGEIQSSAIALRFFKRKMNRFRKIFLGAQLMALCFLAMAFSEPEKAAATLTIDNLRQELIDNEVAHHEIVLRQAILETGWFGCKHCSLDRNNIFGFYYKKQYISYDSWQDCVKYYKRWQDRHYKGGDYYTFLVEVGYATNPMYIQELKSIKGL